MDDLTRSPKPAAHPSPRPGLRRSRRGAIAPFLAMEVAREANARQASGQSIIRFDVGQPHVGAPARALEAAGRALRADRLGYTEALGAMALRRKIAAFYETRYGVALDPRRVVVTTGASGAFVLAFLALFDAGERVAMAAPGYPPYRHILSALGVGAAAIEAGPAEHFQLTGPALRALVNSSGPVAGALVASPANPTGSMLSAPALADLCAAARETGAALISDEIYHGLTYETPAQTALAFDDDALIINSFSKYWAMTGWRVGWLIAPDALLPTIERLGQNMAICAPAPAQAAALAALDETEECEARRAVYAASRAALLETLPATGLAIAAPPDGGFYMMLDIAPFANDSTTFCARALAEAGVALTPGHDFDETRGARWVRLSYPLDEAQAREGVARLAKFLARL